MMETTSLPVPTRAPDSVTGALLALLDARFTFVVGKGGVGKSTCAAALALEAADSGSQVHLLSTDPAHSVGDLFGQKLAPGAPTRAACAPNLVLEEVDAPARARAWLEGVRGPISEIVDLGTYLEAEDVAALLERSLPGMDELMAALRLVELAEGTGPDRIVPDRIVVDTAPTGHFLRMADAGTVLEGWSRALDAMAERAGAVALGLTGRRPRLAGADVIAELRDRVAALASRVLGAADFVIVARAGDVVEGETRRLEEALARRGLGVRARVNVGGAGRGTSSAPVFTVPWTNVRPGCAGLRRWGLDGAARPRPAAPTAEQRAPERVVLRYLAGRDVYLFVGKGGVGKSTCAAAFALELGGRGERVLLLGTDPAGSLGDVLARPIGREEVPVAPGVSARELDADAELTALREQHEARVRAVFERLGVGDAMTLDRRVLESVLDLAPSGVDEIFALEALLDEVVALDGEHGRRTLVVDAAPTGHLLRLLEMPELARSWVRALLRFLLEYRSVLGLDDFAGELLERARRLRQLAELLRDARRTAAVIVTLKEPLVRLESERLARALAAAGIPVAAVVHNLWRGGTAPSWGGEGMTPPVFLAPAIDPPPVGPGRLAVFLDRWSAA
ncbi:MAG TPA: TRC40/GET3/ArsA family transport-energizing ATPase [Longimicrobiales bacterium]|nr:TRC40/GET3/ArsA family transport-energizing ATPase [Longimicrobiales bacterium]